MYRKPIAWTAALIAALLWTPTLTAESGTINASAVNLRNDAALDSPVLMKLPYGTPCDVLETASGWTRVRLKDKPAVVGYVSSSLVSPPPFVASADDERLIRTFKAELFAPDSTADIYRHRVDVSANPEVEKTPEYEKRARECLERWLYWDVAAPAKYRVWLMDIVERYHTYDGVPIEVLRSAQALRIGPESYVDTVETARVTAAHLPPPSPSFFVATPKHFVVARARPDRGSLSMEQSHVVFLQALPLVGGEQGATVHVDKVEGHLAYVSNKPIDFVTVPLEGGAPALEKATMVFVPAEKHIHLEVDGTPAPGRSPDPVHVILAPDSILRRIAASTKITVTRDPAARSGEAGAPPHAGAYSIGFDLDGEGVLDLVQRLDPCPEDPANSRDLVNYFNVGDRWEPLLFWRTWCQAAGG